MADCAQKVLAIFQQFKKQVAQELVWHFARAANDIGLVEDCAEEVEVEEVGFKLVN